MKREKITYLFNSGFIYEDERDIFVFDYYAPLQGNTDVVQDYIEKASPEKKITVFVSHGHHDHYSREIFRWRDSGRNIRYIISSDVTDALSHRDDDTEFLDRDNLKGLRLSSGAIVRTFGSTDIGISFLVSTREKTIFHSGDLNWWDWGDEDSEEEAAAMERDFKNIVGDLKEFLKGRNLDLAFFPVDPRLEERAYKGALYFIEQISPLKLIPMHFGDKFQVCEYLKNLCSDKKTLIGAIKKDGKITF